MGKAGKDIFDEKTVAASKPKEEVKELPKEEKKPEEDWTEEQQRRLEAGLKKFPNTLDPKERWGSIAKEVGDKSAKECLSRFKYIAAKLKSKA